MAVADVLLTLSNKLSVHISHYKITKVVRAL